MEEKCKSCGEPMIVGHICKGSIERKLDHKPPGLYPSLTPVFCTWTIRNSDERWKTECGAQWPPMAQGYPLPTTFLSHLETMLKFCPLCGKEIIKSHSVDAAWIAEQLAAIRERTNLDDSIYDAGQYICQFLDYLNFPAIATEFRAILDGE